MSGGEYAKFVKAIASRLRLSNGDLLLELAADCGGSLGALQRNFALGNLVVLRLNVKLDDLHLGLVLASNLPQFVLQLDGLFFLFVEKTLLFWD